MAIDVSEHRATKIAKLWVNVMWWLGLFGATLGLLILLASPLIFSRSAGSVTVQVAISDDVPLAQPRALQGSGATVEVEDGSYRLEIPTDRPVVLLMWMGPLLLMVGLMLAGLYQLRKFLDDVLAGLVFTVENAARLSRMAWLALVLAVAMTPVSFLSSWLVLRTTGLGVAGVKPASVNGAGSVLILGLLLLVLASAWRQGADLQRERDLTV